MTSWCAGLADAVGESRTGGRRRRCGRSGGGDRRLPTERQQAAARGWGPMALCASRRGGRRVCRACPGHPASPGATVASWAQLSTRIAGGVPRVGVANTAELESLGLTVIDLSEISDSSSGSHSKYAGSPEVVQLIGAGLNSVSRFHTDNRSAVQQILAASPIRIFGNGTGFSN